MKRGIVHVITGLPVGGAQTMLMKLVCGMDPTAWHPEVVSLRDEGAVGHRLAERGVPVHAIGMRGRPSDLGGMVSLATWLRARRPSVVQTWLYHADLFGGLAARWTNAGPVVWNVRQSTLDASGDRRSTIVIARFCGRLSRRIPERIICCSEASRRTHRELGYDDAKMVVIPNGFDVEAFRPDEDARGAIRAELGLDDETPVIGLMARFHPQKDHRTFLEAARRLVDRQPQVRFVLCGEAVDAGNAVLRRWVAELGLGDKCHLLGVRSDVPRVQAALDVASLTSAFGEGFPNVLGEAMACGVPCVVTDVGDSALIVGETGKIVPPRDPEALAEAWRDLLDAGRETRRRLGAEARLRIASRFRLRDTIERYRSLYDEISDH